MSLSTSFFVLLLFFYLHPCKARSFWLFDQTSRTQISHFSSKVENKFVSVEATTGKAITDKSTTNEGAIFKDGEPKDSAFTTTGREGSHEIFKSSSLPVTPKSTITEGSSTRRALPSVVGFGSNGREAIASNNKNKLLQEEAMVIDYDPPRQSPPIHNRKA